MSRHYKSVSEMVSHLCTDESFKRKVLAEIKNRNLTKLLFALRCKKGMSQKQLAEKMGATQSRVSKIESAPDAEITVKDLLDYAKALGLRLEIGYRESSAKMSGAGGRPMRAHYDFSKMNGRKNPHAKFLKSSITIQSDDRKPAGLETGRSKTN